MRHAFVPHQAVRDHVSPRRSRDGPSPSERKWQTDYGPFESSRSIASQPTSRQRSRISSHSSVVSAGRQPGLLEYPLGGMEVGPEPEHQVRGNTASHIGIQEICSAHTRGGTPIGNTPDFCRCLSILAPLSVCSSRPDPPRKPSLHINDAGVCVRKMPMSVGTRTPVSGRTPPFTLT